MQYEKADGRCGNLVDANDPAYRSFDKWVKAGRPVRKAVKAKPQGAGTVVTISDPEAWRLELAQRRAFKREFLRDLVLKAYDYVAQLSDYQKTNLPQLHTGLFSFTELKL